MKAMIFCLRSNLLQWISLVSLKRSTHSFADGDGLLGHRLGVGHVVLHDGLEELIFILPVERRLKRNRQTHVRNRSDDGWQPTWRGTEVSRVSHLYISPLEAAIRVVCCLQVLKVSVAEYRFKIWIYIKWLNEEFLAGNWKPQNLVLS